METQMGAVPSINDASINEDNNGSSKAHGNGGDNSSNWQEKLLQNEQNSIAVSNVGSCESIDSSSSAGISSTSRKKKRSTSTCNVDNTSKDEKGDATDNTQQTAKKLRVDQDENDNNSSDDNSDPAYDELNQIFTKAESFLEDRNIYAAVKTCKDGIESAISSSDITLLELALHRVDKLAISSRENIPPSTPNVGSGIIEFTLARAEVLLRLMQHVENVPDQKSIKDFVYYFGLLRKDTEFIISDGDVHQNRALRIMSDANQMLANKAAKSSESTHTNPILVLLDDIFKNPDLVKEAEELLTGTSDDEIDIKLCELLQLPSRNLPKEEYVKEENRLRDELGKAFQDRTGCTLNFGQGLSLEDLCIRVIIIMNYATKECEGYTGGLDWLDLMDLDNGCIHLWYKGLVTLSTITAGGPRPTYTKGVHDTRGIAFTDRVDMIPDQKDGYEDLFSNFCTEVRSTKTKMHLVNAIFLALKVHFLNINNIIPSVLGTGAPVRDYLLNKNTDVRITPRVISLGWLVHSQKIMNKGGMLLHYSEEQIQEFSNTVTRAYALLDPSVPVAADYPDIIGMFCDLYELSDEQRAAIREARRQHGFASGKMRTEAAEIYAILLEDGYSSKGAMEWILSELSEAHYNLYDACLRVGDMRTKAKEMYHKLIGNTEKLSREQALDRIEKELSVKHRNLYEGCLKTNDMKTEAKEMYHKLMKEDDMTREKALDRIGKKLSAKHRKLYEGCSKTYAEGRGKYTSTQQVRDKNDQNLQQHIQQLTSPWQQHTDPSTGKLYYYNPTSRESQWSHPAYTISKPNKTYTISKPNKTLVELRASRGQRNRYQQGGLHT